MKTQEQIQARLNQLQHDYDQGLSDELHARVEACKYALSYIRNQPAKTVERILQDDLTYYVSLYSYVYCSSARAAWIDELKSIVEHGWLTAWGGRQ
jgi:hypothetical protein